MIQIRDMKCHIIDLLNTPSDNAFEDFVESSMMLLHHHSSVHCFNPCMSSYVSLPFSIRVSSISVSSSSALFNNSYSVFVPSTSDLPHAMMFEIVKSKINTDVVVD
jgi:hypothetical protein